MKPSAPATSSFVLKRSDPLRYWLLDVPELGVLAIKTIRQPGRSEPTPETAAIFGPVNP